LDYEGTPLRTKAPPILSRGETAPEYFGQRKFKDIPILKLNDSVVRKIYYGRSDDDYKETSEIGEDEGFASDGTEEDHTKQNEDESSSEYNSPIEEYNIESLSELESLDTQSSEERDEKEESGEADDGDEVSDDDDSEDEDEDSYCIDEQPYKPHTALLQSPRFHSNPAEVSDDDDDEDDEDYSEDDEDDSEDDEDDSEDDKDDSEDDEDDSEDDEDDSEDDEDDSEDEDDDSEDNDEDDEDNSEDEDEDFYCIDEQPHKPHTTLRRSPRFNNTPKG
jgi:hypothetical protein